MTPARLRRPASCVSRFSVSALSTTALFLLVLLTGTATAQDRGGEGGAPVGSALESYVVPGRTPRPAPVTLGTNQVTWDGTVANFVYQGPDGRIDYYCQPRLSVFAITAQRGKSFFNPCSGGTVSGSTGTIDKGSEVFDGDRLTATFDNGAYTVTYQMIQKTLVLTFGGQLFGIDPGVFRNPTDPSASMWIPFSGKFGIAMTEIEDAPLFATCFHDFVYSRADGRVGLEILDPSPGPTARYASTSRGFSTQERLYVTASPDIHEVFPDIPFDRGAGVDELAPKMFLGEWDGWQVHCDRRDGGAFEDAKKSLIGLASYRCEEVYYVRHDWEYCENSNCVDPPLFPCENACGTFDPCCPDPESLLPLDAELGLPPGFSSLECTRCCTSAPTVLPADDKMGGMQGLRELSDLAQSLGYPFGLYTIYDEFYGTPDGERLPAALEWEPQIHDQFNTTMDMQDVLASDVPRYYEDYLERIEVLDVARAIHGGLLISEGGHGANMLCAGIVDAVEGEFAEFNRNEEVYCDGDTCSPWTGRFGTNLWLDYDILKIRPRMIQQGIGYEPRFFRADSGNNRDWFSKIDLTEEQHDIKRAFQIAFAHQGGFCLRYDDVETEEIVKEYYVMQQLHSRYLGAAAQPVQIKYSDGSRGFAGLETALRRGYVAADGMIQYRTRWDNDLEIHVNLRPEILQVDAGGNLLDVPQYGWVAYQPAGGGEGEFLCSSTLLGGTRVDEVRSDAYDFVDGRGTVRQIGAIRTDGAVIALPSEGTHVDLLPIEAAGSIRRTNVLRVKPERYLTGDPKTMTVSFIDVRGRVIKPAAFTVTNGDTIVIEPSELRRLSKNEDSPASNLFGIRIAR